MEFTAPGKLTTAFSNHSISRPQFHFTPDYGWMNDPNGLWYDKENKMYHLYFQYNPADTVWNLPLYWGHATSKDLIFWTQNTDNRLPIGPAALDENGNYQRNGEGVTTEVDPKSGAYSGSIFLDEGNASGWFNNKTGKNNVVAAWTYNYPHAEKQWVSYSLDDGVTFINPEDGSGKAINPVVEDGNNTEHFRDPQVIRYDNTNDYIMTVARPQVYKIFFYKSTDLKNWEKQTDFELEGFLGYQYECPNLVHLHNSDTTGNKFEDSFKDSYWVLFISINPGSMQGGSSTWYMIGQFGVVDGNYAFTPTYHYAAPLDYGKDFYAMQIMYNSGGTLNEKGGFDSVIGIAWASNWQYTGVVPTDPWRSSMSLARKVSLGKFNSSPERSIIYLKSEPVEGNVFSQCTDHISAEIAFNEGSSNDYPIDDPTGSFKFKMTFTVDSNVFNNDNPGHLDIKLSCVDDSEYLLLGYQSGATSFYLDRSHSNVEWVKSNPYFNDKVSVNLINDPSVTKATSFKVNGYVDRNIIELFFNDGYQTMTNTFFFTGGNYINKVTISSDYGTNGFKVSEFSTCPFKSG
jgi:beta-fructofuranosidase